MAGKVEGEWTLIVVGAGVVAARTAIEVAEVEAVEADCEKLMFRSTGVAEEAACIVYLAISKLQAVTIGGAVGDGEGLRGEKWRKKNGERMGGETKDKGGEKGENKRIKEGMC